MISCIVFNLGIWEGRGIGKADPSTRDTFSFMGSYKQGYNMGYNNSYPTYNPTDSYPKP